MFRPAEQLVHPGPIAVIDGQACAILDGLLGLDKVYRQVRGQNEQLDNAITAIRLAGAAYRENASRGTVSAPQQAAVSQSKSQLNDTLGTTDAATLLHMTRRAVSNECKQKRLPAMLVGGRYRIHPDDLKNYRGAQT
jgi:hypothetical protein